MKLVDRFTAPGTNHHTIWVYEGDSGRQLAINGNHDVLNERTGKPGDYYVFDYGVGGGEGCGTIWLGSLAVARELVAQLIETDQPVPTGRDAGLCKQCQCHYRFGSMGWRRFEPYACAGPMARRVEAAISCEPRRREVRA